MRKLKQFSGPGRVIFGGKEYPCGPLYVLEEDKSTAPVVGRISGMICDPIDPKHLAGFFGLPLPEDKE